MAAMIKLGAGPEFDLIRKFLAQAPAADGDVVRVGPGDDCAIVIGDQLAVSCDLSVENVHFRRDWISAQQIGYRACAAALSDLAAVAASPIGALVAIALPWTDTSEFGGQIMRGVNDALQQHAAVLLGGDVSRAEHGVVLAVTVLGAAARPVLRSGARATDEVWVTGSLGGAAVAVHEWLNGNTPPRSALARYAQPQPRMREALWLNERLVIRAMIDLSDGLAGDAGHLAAASGVGIVLDAERIPIAEVARRRADALELAYSGGEDYELCFTAAAGSVEPLREAFTAEFAAPLTRVGTVVEGSGVHERLAGGEIRPLAARGYQHFGETQV